MAEAAPRTKLPLIASKLTVPELPETYAPRPRLRHCLHSAMEGHHIVSVSATAGAGKTTAVVDAVRTSGRPVAWLSVDRTDRTAGRLLAYLEASITRIAPDAADVASGAMAAQIPHPEAAGLLAEALGELRPVIVLDDVERLCDAEPAWAVIDAFARYAARATLVLISRQPLPGHLLDLPVGPVVALIGEADLALTKPEAEQVLTGLGREKDDPGRIIETTGGWMAGVVFGATPEPGQEGDAESDPLHRYLAEQVVGRLPDSLREFLVTTSLLAEVDADRATALGVTGAAAHLAALRAVHLPGTWYAHQRVFRCHPAFRDFLLEQFDHRAPAERHALRLAHARMLVADGDDEAAVTAFLRASAPDEALGAAQRAITHVIGRADLDLAEDWLATFSDAESPADPAQLTVARLALAVVKDEYQQGVDLCDALLAADTRQKLAHESNDAAVLMAWLYGVSGRVADADAIVGAARPSPAISAMSYGLQLMDPQRSSTRPDLIGNPIDAYVLECDYFRGRLAEFAAPLESRWAQTVIGSYSIAALRASGQTQRALDACRSYSSRLGRLPLQSFIEPEVLLDAGLMAEAREALTEGRRYAAEVGAAMYELLAQVVEAKIAARHDKDAATAHDILDRLEESSAHEQFWCVGEMATVWRCLALLHEGRDEEAALRLRRAVSTMQSAGGVLELPTAAVYLAEAEWRLGNEQAADTAASVALAAARGQESNHLLLQALADFPLVASRQLDAEADTESPWHTLGRSLALQSRHVTMAEPGDVEIVFHDLGTPRVLVNGEPARPRIAKTYELLAFLASQPGRTATRDTLLTALFDGRADSASRAYLRQAVRWLKVLVPGDDAVQADRSSVRLSPNAFVRSDSARFETAVTEAGRLRDTGLVAALTEALRIPERGAFLDGTDSAWATRRRQELQSLEAETRFTLATHLYRTGRLTEAQHHTELGLDREPLRESGWRLLMRIAAELGDSDKVILAFRECENALDDIGMTASPATRRLLENLSP
ncbi:BTAD domain-containing putative transcriptional regulator [Streptomyces mirabilis]|uniref:BTAD domain-containing putative transcriptional regulator n=1 Tax=Streptomyces mirabilis TaxID=68239 RepID=UPI0036C3543F